MDPCQLPDSFLSPGTARYHSSYHSTVKGSRLIGLLDPLGCEISINGTTSSNHFDYASPFIIHFTRESIQAKPTHAFLPGEGVLRTWIEGGECNQKLPFVYVQRFYPRSPRDQPPLEASFLEDISGSRLNSGAKPPLHRR
ncbi:hypothetical protein KM043_002467 [Ampulex compressa]|nr:hypothetical protein KM043_002467 [Ampulex compressa]